MSKADERKPEREVYLSTASTGTGFCSYEKPALKSFPSNCKPVARILGRIQAERCIYRYQETLAHQELQAKFTNLPERNCLLQ